MYPKTSYVFCIWILTVFGGENDVKRLTAKFKFQVMAKQRNDFGRAWRDKNKCEKSCGHDLLTKRTCKNIQEPIVCRIVLGRLNLKLCPETKKNTQEYSS